MPPPFRLMAVIDRGTLSDDAEFLARVVMLASVPGLWLQLRVKTLAPAARRALLKQAASRLGAARARTIVNGTIAEARALRCAGAHYPEAALPERLVRRAGLVIGASVHSRPAQRRAERAGVDYVIAGAVFAPASKPGAGRGLAWLAKLARGAQAPVIAIGGITPRRIGACLAHGAAGIAVLGGIVLADDPKAAARAYQKEIRRLGDCN